MTDSENESKELSVHERKQRKKEKRMGRMFPQVRKIIEESAGKCVPYFRLIIHPTDVRQSIANASSLQYMVHEGLIARYTDEAGEEMVRLMSEGEAELLEGAAVPDVGYIGYRLCEAMVKQYNIKKPMLQPIDGNSDSEESD